MIVKIDDAIYHGDTATDLIRCLANVARVEKMQDYMSKVALTGRTRGLDIRTASPDAFIESLISAGLAEKVSLDKIN